MRLPTLSYRSAWVFVLAVAFATWIAIFFQDEKRPLTVQEKADRLASENYLSGSLTAPSPPSPAHWAQRGIWQDSETGARFALAREASAIALFLTGGHATVAGVIAFGLGASLLFWLISTRIPLNQVASSVLTALLMTGVAHGRSWQMDDPYPYLLLAASTCCLGNWIKFRRQFDLGSALMLGTSMGGLAICEAALFIGFALAIVIDVVWLKSRLEGSLLLATKSLVKPMLFASFVPGLVLALYCCRNYVVTDRPLTSPRALYIEKNTSAPEWLWQTIRIPPDNVDSMIERYDELIGLPLSRWETPIYKVWLNRLLDGAGYAGGLGLAIIGIAYALWQPRPENKPAILVAALMAVISLSYYPLAATWWIIQTGAIGWLLASLIESHESRSAQNSFGAPCVALCVIQLLGLSYSPKAKPTQNEYDYLKYFSEIVDKIKKQEGKHLIFVGYNVTADARVEPADLRHDWESQRFLVARDLGDEANKKLAAGLPDYTPWRIEIASNQIAVKTWLSKNSPASATVSNPNPQVKSK